jgi:hypothetical protein
MASYKQMKRRKPNARATAFQKAPTAEVLDRAFARLIEAVERVVDRHMPERHADRQKAGAA